MPAFSAKDFLLGFREGFESQSQGTIKSEEEFTRSAEAALLECASRLFFVEEVVSTGLVSLGSLLIAQTAACHEFCAMCCCIVLVGLALAAMVLVSYALAVRYARLDHVPCNSREEGFAHDGFVHCTRCEPPRDRPPGSHHCSQCAVCVEGMTHHCPLLACCVGASNLKA